MIVHSIYSVRNLILALSLIVYKTRYTDYVMMPRIEYHCK